MSVSYCQPLDKSSGRHSSSTLIAHLMHQEYPPKVQPRSSSTRHGQPLMPQNTLDFKALLDYTSLDKVDAEAGCILIQLANHSPVDALTMPPSTNAATTTTLLQAGKNNSKCSSSLANSLISTLSSSSSSSSSTTGSNNSMSISSLLSSDAPPSPTLTCKPQVSEQRPMASEKGTEYTQKSEDAWNDSMQSDPIMLLAAAAEAVTNNDKTMTSKDRRRPSGKLYGEFFNLSHERNETQANEAPSKRKWSNSLSDTQEHTHRRLSVSAEKRIRPAHDSWQEHEVQEERNPRTDTNSFSWQYLSMKQNPKIKRNAMHAYITYMIYTDMVDEHSRPGKPIRDTFKEAPRHEEPHLGSSSMVQLSMGQSSMGPSSMVQSSMGQSSVGQSSMVSSSMGQPPTEDDYTLRGRTLDYGETLKTSLIDTHSSPATASLYTNQRTIDVSRGPALPPAPTNESMWYSSSYSPVQERPPMMNFSLAPPPSTGSIMARPLTAFLWEDASTKTSERKHEGVTLPPLSSRSLSHVNTPPANGTFQ